MSLDGPQTDSGHDPARSSAPPRPERVVGIGSSAGGLSALQALVGGLSTDSGAAFLVAQHLSPRQPSRITELLRIGSTLPVATATDGEPLTANVVLVAPPNRDIVVAGDVVRVVEPGATPGPKPNVDRLFQSIADEWGSKGVGVVLSGSGSDGAHGLRAIRAADGLTVAQDPREAGFDSMPSAAVALDAVDLVCDAASIGRRLAQVATSRASLVDRSPGVPESKALGSITSELRQATNIDFSGFKESTLLRQVHRRMTLLQLETLDEYRGVLHSSGTEAEALRACLLVTVTSFFRDPEAFAALKERLEKYIRDRVADTPIRVWIPGCATGEEVYSIAMILGELLPADVPLDQQLRIFATDLDEAALALARRGRYPASVADHIPTRLQGRFSSVTRDGLEIIPALRDCLVFAQHNLGADPPFPQLDLISCRNTLMYFVPELQERVLHSFRYSLIPGGLLFLGRSETVSPESDSLSVVDQQSSIFTRTATMKDYLSPAGTRSTWRPPRSAGVTAPIRPRSTAADDTMSAEHTALLEGILGELGPPGLVLDADHHLVHVIGDVGRYCQLPGGRLTSQAGSFLRPSLQAEARAVLLLARAGRAASGRVVQVEGSNTNVRLEARPIELGQRLLILLLFHPVEASQQPGEVQVERDEAIDSELKRLERELLASQESLRATVSDLEASNEELQASSEELAAATEELQSSYEELETSNEELQATNDQLGSVNRELRDRGVALEFANADLERVQASLNQGMVQLDVELKVTRFTPLAVRVFALVDADIGEPLSSIRTTMPVEGLDDALRNVAIGGSRRTLEVHGSGVVYLLQILRHTDPTGRPTGVLITMTDVTDMNELRRKAELALEDLTLVIESVGAVFWRRNGRTGELGYLAGHVDLLTGYLADDLINRPTLLDSIVHREDLPRVVTARDDEQDQWSVGYRIKRRDGSLVAVTEIGRRIHDPAGDILVALVMGPSEAEKTRADHSK